LLAKKYEPKSQYKQTWDKYIDLEVVAKYENVFVAKLKAAGHYEPGIKNTRRHYVFIYDYLLL